MLSSIREWMNGNHGSIMLIVMGLHRDLVNHNKNHRSSKTSSKPTIHESLVVFSVISCEEFKTTLQCDTGVCLHGVSTVTKTRAKPYINCIYRILDVYLLCPFHSCSCCL